MPERLRNVRFDGTLRPSQEASVRIIREQLQEGERELHIVAPPGSGKTVLGLYVWADLVKRPALVLSPNSAIQAQWTARAKELFDLDGYEEAVVTNPENPGILTSLTYQSVTLPRRGDEDLEARARALWVETLIAEGEAEDPASADAWIAGLRASNASYHNERLGTYRKKVRDADVRGGKVLGSLAASARENLDRLVDAGVGLIVLDECHHLLRHWGRVLSEVRGLFDDPVVLGLTATPPDFEDADSDDAERYRTFFGPIDYEVPVPALVRDGNLAPYQDLAYFVRPSVEEMRYIAGVDEDFERLVAELRDDPPSPAEGEPARVPGLDGWLEDVLGELRLPGGEAKDWTSFRRRDEVFADAARMHLEEAGRGLPAGVPFSSSGLLVADWPEGERLVALLDRYIRHGLRRSPSPADQALAEKAISRLRMMGTQITETGMRACASPVGRVMAYASAKLEAVKVILKAEHRALGDRLRAVLVTDFEKTSATALVEGVLDEEAGGAVAAFRALLTDPETDALDPVFMTGSTVLVDDDLLPRILPYFERWIGDLDLEINLAPVERDGYYEIKGGGKHWRPRHYTQMITEAFQEGITRCLVGTRGLLGEGWDASRINVLVDLTTVTTSMSINQLRGRSFRLDKDWLEKVANNWDVVCLAEEFRRGFDDYRRFKRKHSQLYGVCDDGAIEQGVGHVHAAFTDARPEGVSERLELFNEEMLQRATRRPEARGLWKVGTPFDETPREAVEAKIGLGGGEFPPFKRLALTEWNNDTLANAIALVVVRSLQDAGELSRYTSHAAGDRGGGWLRFYLRGKGADEKSSEVFAEAMQQVLGPLDNPRYMIPRHVTVVSETWLSRTLPSFIGRFFRKRRNLLTMYHAVPKRLAKNKELAEIFQGNWNKHVSPGAIVYGYGDAGGQAVQEAIEQGLSPQGSFHRKKVFGSG